MGKKTRFNHWREVPESFWRWPNFSPEEMACRGTGKLLVDEDAMDALQALRNELGRPIIVNSAYRSPEHNRAVGGATQSKHLQAEAFDCRMDNHEPTAFEAAAKRHGFLGFGHYVTQGFMHIDLGPARRWTGSDGKWFRVNPRTPNFQPEPQPDRVRDTLLKPEVLGPAGGLVSGGAAVANGDGPVQYALAAVMVILVVGGIVWFIRRQSFKPKPKD